MIFTYPDWSQLIEWKNKLVPTVVIENQQAFRTFLCELYNALDGIASKCVLSKDEKILDMCRDVEILTEFVYFDINKKMLINKVLIRLESIAQNADNYLSTQQLLSQLENMIDSWTAELPCNLIASKLSVSSLVKMFGIEFKNDYSGHIGEMEKILDYMELVREFDRDKVFITVNIRSFFQDSDMERFLQTCITHEYFVLMIEASSYPVLSTEKRITIDSDLCEF